MSTSPATLPNRLWLNKKIFRTAVAVFASGLLSHFGLGAVEIVVSPDVIAKNFPQLENADFKAVVYRKGNYHVLEDASSYRSEGVVLRLSQAFANPSFKIFYFQDGKLHRHFFVGGGENGTQAPVSDVLFKVTNRQTHATFHLNLGVVERTLPSSFKMESNKAAIVARLKKEWPRIQKTDLSPLWKKDPRRNQKPNLTEESLFSEKGPWGLGGLEFLGGRDGRCTWRARLGSADTEVWRKENSAARAYFIYIDDASNGDLTLYFTIGEYSIYIK